MKNLYKIFLTSIFFLIAFNYINAQTIFTVTKTTDPDPFVNPYYFDDSECDPEMLGTLQWAIRKSNDTGGACIINFDIETPAPYKIRLNNYLPVIESRIILDGTTQSGYIEGTPIINIEANNFITTCFSAYGVDELTIKGFSFHNFIACGISLENCNFCTISDNIVTLVNSNFLASKIGLVRIRLINCTNVNVFNNQLNTANDGSPIHGPDNYGIAIYNSENCTIGADLNSNLIEDCATGIMLDNSQNIRLIQNVIYGGTSSILLNNGSNSNKGEPILLNYDNSTINGIAQANDIIEVFGSNDEDDANVYFGTVNADDEGKWSLETNNEYFFFTATATDANNNTSKLCNVMPTNSICSLPYNLQSTEGINATHTLSWESSSNDTTFQIAVGIKGLSPADSEWLFAYTPITGNSITLNGFDENTIYEYYIYATCESGISHWAGPKVFNVEVETHNNCQNALFEESDTLPIQQIINLKNDEFWIKFTAITDTCYIEIESVVPNLWEIEEVYLYTGECDNLTLVHNEPVAQTTNTGIYIHNYDMIPNQNYYLRIVQDTTSVSIDYFLNITHMKANICNDDDIQCLVCDNLVPNYSFELYSSNYTDEKPFSDGYVCCGWQTAFGSPQINEGDIGGTNAAHIWLSNHNTNNNESQSIGEGIFVNIENIEIDEEYVLNFKFKAETLYGNEYNEPYSELRVLLTNENTFNIDMQIYGSSVPNYDNFNNTDYQILFDTPQIIDENWIDVSISFTADDNYGTLLIYPQFNSEYLDWILEEDLSVTGFNIDNIRIYPNPGFEIYQYTYCNNETEVQLVASPDNGTWSGAGVLSPDGLFNPSLLDAGESSVYYTYSYLDIIGSECEITTEFLISILPGPNPPSFDVQECLYREMSEGFTFEDTNNSDDSPFEWTWEIGNESIGEGQNISYSFQDYGYYCINLEVSSEHCGATSYSEIVYVNNNICACNESESGYYDYTYTHGYTISSNNNETWSSPEIIYVEGDIFIQTNAILTIGENTSIAFAPNGRIIVEAGGKLMIESNVTLTSIYFASWSPQTINDDKIAFICENNMWQGIEVWGNNEFPHDMEMQGIVEIIDRNQVIIANAHIGILSGARSMDHICNSTLYPNPFDESKGCGLVHLSESSTEFLNNGIGIKLLPREPLNTIGAFGSGNIINGIDFKTTQGLVDHHYLSSDFNPYPNTYNPWAGHANPDQRTDVGLYINGIRGLNVEDCDFEDMQYGISSIDSKYNVYQTYFTNARYGIQIFSSSPSLNTAHEIWECKFNIMSVNAIYINNGVLDKIHDNSFGNLETSQDYNNVAIQTFGASRFRIYENTFYYFKIGVRVYISGPNGGFIGAGASTLHDDWEGNIFRYCNTNIFTKGDNKGLKLRCNMCNNYDDELYNVNFKSIGYMSNQGYHPPATEIAPEILQRYGAGNEFWGTADHYKKIESDTHSYRYYHQSNYETTPEVSSFWSAANAHIYPTDLDVTKIDNPSACMGIFFAIPIPIAIPFPWPWILSLQDQQDWYVQEYENISYSLDNGKTEELIDNIYGNMSNGELKNKLVENSPLSDTVITALLVEYPLSHGNFKNVMQLNMPVSDNVEPYLFERISTLPTGISRQLEPLQAQNPNARTHTNIKDDIEFWEMEEQLLINDLLISLTDTINNNFAQAKELLEYENTLSSKQLLYNTYRQESDSISASYILNDIALEYDNDDWIRLQEIFVSLEKQEKTLYNMDSIQFSFIQELAYKCPPDRASFSAQAVLHLLLGEEVPECEYMSTRKTHDLVKDVKFVLPENDAYIEDNFPDPFIDKTLVNYYMPNNMDGKLVVYDMFGRVTGEYILETGEKTLVISSIGLVPGVYTYSLVVNDKIIDVKKMVITQ